jgi:HTH-type transcriptional regulator/antitoxin HipB
MPTTDSIQLNVRNAAQLRNSVRRFRKLKKITQKTLAEQSGLKQTTISKIESGLIQPTLPTIFKLLAALDLEFVVRKRMKG